MNSLLRELRLFDYFNYFNQIIKSSLILSRNLLSFIIIFYLKLKL